MSCEKKVKEDETRWLIIRAKVYEETIKAAFELFRAHEVEPILIKGWAAAQEYPENYRRISSDIDLCVSPAVYKKGVEIADAQAAKALNIDLHCGLRHLDTVEWEDLFENSVIRWIDDVQVRILRPEDHLRVLCVHWLNDGGAFKERLLDICYLLENHSKDFDWDRCLGKVSKNRREWIIKTIAIAHKYFNLDVSELPFAGETKSIPRWFVNTLESEWASTTKLIPLHTLLGSRKEFWKQVKKRFPPNAIEATIEMEGPFDDSWRGYYQAGSIILRLKPSLKRIYNSLKIYLRRKHR